LREPLVPHFLRISPFVVRLDDVLQLVSHDKPEWKGTRKAGLSGTLGPELYPRTGCPDGRAGAPSKGPA
jgi:hypothetical protein